MSNVFREGWGGDGGANVVGWGKASDFYGRLKIVQRWGHLMAGNGLVLWNRLRPVNASKAARRRVDASKIVRRGVTVYWNMRGCITLE